MQRKVLVLVVAFLFPVCSSAQFYYFGRNKVQYTRFEWHVLKTAHFDIYYYPEMADLAEYGASFAEESYTVLEQKFNHSVNTRIPLIFYSSHLHFEQTNTTAGFIPEGVGGFFEFLKGRVVIPADGSIAQFRHVIRHELVHVFTTSKLYRVLSDHRKSSDREPPLWFTEGLAEYWSTGWDAQGEMVMRDAVLNGTVAGLDDMDRIYGSFQMYKEGQNALQFLSERYGEQKILALIENFWKTSSFSDDFKITIGKNYREFDEEWLYALRKEYYPLLAVADVPSRAALPIAREGFNSKPVVMEVDSLRKLLFIANRTGYTGIYEKDLASKDPEDQGKMIIEGERSNEFEAFHLLRGRIDVNHDGILAFVTKSGENDALYLYDVREDEVTRSFQWSNVVSMGSVSWAPDDRHLAFSAIDKGGRSDLFILDVVSGDTTRLTNDYYDDRDPAWAPDGRTIAFSSDRTSYGSSGVYNLFLYTVATGSIDYLTYGPASDESPAWSRDGSLLAFTSDAGGIQNIWTMDMKQPLQNRSRTVTQVTRFTTSAFDPTWTSSGDLIFATFEKYGFQIRSMRNVRGIIDTSSSTRTMDLAFRDAPWHPRRIDGNSALKSLRYTGEYSLDLAQSAISTDPVFGTTGGAILSLSDILGNEEYYFLLYNTAQTQSELLSSFNVAISRISLGQRTNYAYGVFRFAGRRYDLTDKDEFYYERVFGGYFTLSYPLTKFERIETSVSLSNSSKQADVAFAERKALLLSNSISFVHDNSLWGPSGPLDGSRFDLTFAYTSDVQYSNVDYVSIIADYRQYFRLSTRSAFATRLWLFYNHGKESRQFVMGGSWDLRGYPLWSLHGEKLWLISNELRFPFIDQLAVRFPFGSLGFWGIRGALFFDAGAAWDNQYTQTLGSMGAGLRLNLGGVLVLRFDTGKRIENNFSTIEHDWFTQFFFGWDF
ncbi:MAG: BamA/TamA family outer membrane protein [Bacteroidota bacterium]